MINVSNEFKELMQKRTNFMPNAEITFPNGSVVPLDVNDFSLANNTVTESAETDTFVLGMPISRDIQIEIVNNLDQYSTYDFVGAKIRFYLTYQLSNTIEKIEFGTFTVTDPETYGTTIIIVAHDDMYKADKKFTTGLSFPSTAGALLRDICSRCDISLYSASFRNSDYVINEQPSGDYTYRQVIGWISMIAGGNARINRSGSLEIISYDFSKVKKIIDGGTFKPWTTGENLDGGTFNLWNTGDIVDGGDFTDYNNIHVLHAFKNLTVDTDDIVITGVSMTEDEETLLYGKEGYVIDVENPLVTRDNYSFLRLLGDVLIGAQFRKFSGDHIAYPLAEAMDLAIVLDRKYNAYPTIITDVNFAFFGFTNLKNSATSAIRNSSTYNSQSVNAYVKNKALIEKNRTEFDKAIEDLSSKLSQTEGAYTTIETVSGGGKVFYLHNKPTVAESQMIWKMTAEAWGVSTDGGKTWNAGMTVDGVVIARILNTIGINADWINTGALSVKLPDGTEIFKVDKDTNEVFINAQYVTIGSKSVSQAITDVDSKASNAQSTANSAQSAASEAQSTANTANTNAQNAQSSADKAQSTANSAQSTANSALSQSNTTSASLEALKTQEAIFNLLTNNGALQGLYMYNGQLYVNASYLKSGVISGDLIQAGDINIGKLPGSSMYASQIGGVYFYDTSGYLTSSYVASQGWRYYYNYRNSNENSYFEISGTGMKFYRSYVDGGVDINYYIPYSIDFDFANDAINATLKNVVVDTLQITAATTTTSGATAAFGSDGKTIYKLSSSSERYKDIERTLTDEDIENLYNIEVYFAKYKDDYLSESDERYQKSMPMFTVENMEEYLPIAVNHNPDGTPEMWNSQIMIPVMFQMLKSQKATIDTLTDRLNKLENLLSTKGVI